MSCTLLRTGYDVSRLQREVNALEAEYNDHPAAPGEWTGISLRSVTGGIEGEINSSEIGSNLIKHGKPSSCKDSIWMERLPYIKQIIAELPREVYLTRLLKLKAGSEIPTHSDGRPFSSTGSLMRLQIPIFTNDQVEFVVDGESFHLQEGNLYHLDVSKLHSVHNRGSTDRIHLVFDMARR